jgi:hypothetical protein
MRRLSHGSATGVNHYESSQTLNVGLSTSIVLLANKLAPGLADRYLARTGYDALQTDEPADPMRSHNLWLPVRGDHGAHGDFDLPCRTQRCCQL